MSGRRWPSFELFPGHRVERGGWSPKWITKAALLAARKRWALRSYATRTEELAQCGGCRHFAALDSDYGLCCNQESENDGRVTFEHGGCAKHDRLDELKGLGADPKGGREP